MMSAGTRVKGILNITTKRATNRELSLPKTGLRIRVEKYMTDISRLPVLLEPTWRNTTDLLRYLSDDHENH